MNDVLYGVWFYILAIIMEGLLGYLAVTGQGLIALFALAGVGLNTLIALSLIFDVMEEPEEES